jgi:Na+-transporting NADH:ubiquinone oxidoreductase subunit C
MSDTPLKTVLVAGGLCLFCSIFVSLTAVKLRPLQERNKVLDLKKNVLMAAGLYDENSDIEEQFQVITPVVVDLSNGLKYEEFEVATYDHYKAMKDPALAESIPANMDLGGLSKRMKYAKAYLVMEETNVKEIILPLYSKGLWSTMYGFLALEGDTKTVKGFSYYAHGETPGLGGEVDNPNWKGLWPGKKVFNDQYEPIIEIPKTAVSSSDPNAESKVDGLSGATITSVGIRNSLHYWLGDHGYGKFLANIRTGAFQL